jgi:von Willebrand factor A domain-containing protein 7
MATRPIWTGTVRVLNGSTIANIVSCAILLFVLPPVPNAGAQFQENRSRRFGPDACGPVDPAYLRMASETGGLPMFFQPSEMTTAGHFMRETQGRETVLWATGKVEEKAAGFVVPVDSSMKRMTFALSVDTKGSVMSIVRPSGAELQPGNAATEISDFNCGRIVTVAPPETGEWRVRLKGTGHFWMEVTAQTDIYFVSVKFVKPGGRPGHEGLFPIQGQPLAGEPATLETTVSGGLHQVAFKLVTEGGDTIKTIPMRGPDSNGSPGDASRSYVGSFDLPSTTFRVAMAGTDAQGREYQRFFHILFHAETVEISSTFDRDGLPPGKTTPVVFKVRNIGAPATFRIIAVDGKQFAKGAEPQELSLGTGETKTVSVEMAVPDNAPIDTGDDLIFTATSTGGQGTSNAFVLHLSVFKEASP